MSDVLTAPLVARPRSQSIASLVAQFSALSAPRTEDLHGRFRAEFVGPFWLRNTAAPSLALLGMPGWWGKSLAGIGTAYNLLVRNGTLTHYLPMQLVDGTSSIDGQRCAILRYGNASPFPWHRVTDELRAIDERTLLGMTRFDFPLVRIVPVPFLLVRE